MGKKLMALLDAGHGGMMDGRYVTAPDKMHRHADGSVAMEGVINRQIKDEAIRMLNGMGIVSVDIAPGQWDIPLDARVACANAIHRDHKATHSVVYVSLHSNAGGGTGFEVFTSRGETLSDLYATVWADEIKREFPGFPFRADYTDSDPDKEAGFTVLRRTDCPAVLGEYLFFDNPRDWAEIQEEGYAGRAARSVCRFLARAEKEIGGQ